MIFLVLLVILVGFGLTLVGLADTTRRLTEIEKKLDRVLR